MAQMKLFPKSRTHCFIWFVLVLAIIESLVYMINSVFDDIFIMFKDTDTSKPMDNIHMQYSLFYNLSKQNEECIRELQGTVTYCEHTNCPDHTNTTCNITNNLSFKVLQRLGLGHGGIVYLVEILGEHYAMKLCTKSMYSQFKVMSTIGVEHNVNIPHIHPLASHLYHLSDGMSFFFMEALENAISWHQFRGGHIVLRSNETIHTMNLYLRSFDTIDGGILHFFIHCYHDIIRILDVLYTKLHAFYWDIHLQNILFDTVNHKCYLIDLQVVMYSNIQQFIYESTKRLHCMFRLDACPPLIFYKFRRIKQRKQYKAELERKNISGVELLALFEKHSLNQSKYQVLHHLLTIFIRYYAELIFDTDGQRNLAARLLAYYTKLVRTLTVRSEMVIQSVWCRRLELIQMLKNSTNNLEAVENDDNIKMEFWKMLELFEDDWHYVNETHCQKLLHSTY
eukprot:140068_1